MRYLRADGRRVDDFGHVVHAAVDADLSAYPVAPLGYLGLVVHDFRIGQRHQGDHGHGKQLIDENLVGDQACDHGLSVVAVLHVVPVHPDQRIQLDT